MTEDEFMHQIAPPPKFTSFYFAPPDWTLGIMASTRAYITFENPEEIYVFRDKYDGYVFVDAKGVEYPAVVEFAPFQGFSKTRSKKQDVKMNTIETDSHFIAFMEALKNAENETKSESKMEFSYQLKEDKEITSTPLLEYLESKKKEKIAEKKRKADEKKKKREEERQARKNKVAKSIPEPIKEETKKEKPTESRAQDAKDKKKSSEPKKEKPEKGTSSTRIEPDDDGIMVRVVPSRLDRNQRKNNTNKEEEPRKDRDRNKSRRERREARNAEKSGEKGDRDSRSDKRMSVSDKTSKETKDDVKHEPKRETKEIDVKPPNESKESKGQEPVKREVKKYSERRKEIRARAENRRNEAEEKVSEMEQTPETLKTSSLDVSAEPFIPGFKKPMESWVVKEGPPGTVEPFPKKGTKKEGTKQQEGHDVESESSAMDEKSEKRQNLSKEEEEKQRKERAERISNLRNKDRPSIAIYQPRRVRIAANFATDGSREKVKTPESDVKIEEKSEKSTRERKHSKEEKRKSEKRERKHHHHRSSGDEKSEKSTRRKRKSVTEDESREMSRQNSQASEATESRHESGEEVVEEFQPESTEKIKEVSKAIEKLKLNDGIEKNVQEDKSEPEKVEPENRHEKPTSSEQENIDSKPENVQVLQE